MKINTNHRFYASVFKQIAELLKDDFVMKTDHTDKDLDLSFIVMHKKYKHHGLVISTYLNENPEWYIEGYADIPVRLPWGTPKYTFTPERDKDNFPLLTDEQLKMVAKKIKSIERDVFDLIKGMKADIEMDALGMSKDEIDSRFSDGFDNLKNFEDYGIKPNYREFLLTPAPKSLTNFRLLQGILNSKIPEVRNLLEDGIDMYIDEMKSMNKDDAYTAANRFMTVDRENSLLAKFTDRNRSNYIGMVKEQFGTLLTTDDPKETYYDIVGFLRSVEGDGKMEAEIMGWAYSIVQDEHFLSDEAKEMFLF